MKKSKRRINMKRKTKKEIGDFFIYLIFFLSIYLLCYGLFIYGKGSHNIDLGHNIRIVNAENNLSYMDITNKFNVWSPTTMYITGFNQIDIALYLCIMGSILFGFFFSFFQIKRGGN